MHLDQYLDQYLSDVARYGSDILASENMLRSRTFIQHGATSVYEHSLHVAAKSLELARRMKLHVDERAMVRGALLHDFFLYDWHVADPTHRLHGFYHARTAYRNAEKEFALGRIERDVILRHMFPLTLIPPRCREGLLVCLADKLCAVSETVPVRLPAR